jgi:rhodanese-related sulfurtransferase
MREVLSPADLRAALADERHVGVVDVREPLDYAEGHVEESTLVPRRDLEFRLPAVVPSKRARVVLCDQRGERAPQDADWLRFLGYEDVAHLAGGVDAWVDAGLPTVERQAGVYGTAFNYPSKAFGEKVQVERGVEQIQPDELRALLDEHPETIVTDVRTPAEYHGKTIPGALNVEGVDLGLYLDRLRDRDQPVVVNCAGRTRSIIGAATLAALGHDDVYELENGTMGWELAGYELERGAERYVRDLDVDGAAREDLRERVLGLLDERAVRLLSPADLRRLRGDPDEVVYVLDVRPTASYERGHLPDARSVPGGQAIQTADDHVAVRDGTVVFVSDDVVRAGITAYWFAEMGYPDVAVLDGGLDAWRAADLPVATGPDEVSPPGRAAVESLATRVSPEELVNLQRSSTPTVVHVDDSESFREGHVPGAVWVPRYHLDGWLAATREPDALVVFTCRDGTVSTYAAAAVTHGLGMTNVWALAGGTEAWVDAGRSLATGEDGLTREPRDVVPKPYHQGEWAKRAYLEWETRLGDRYA